MGLRGAAVLSVFYAGLAVGFAADSDGYFGKFLAGLFLCG